MTTREKIISLLETCAEPDGDFGIDNAITFYHEVRNAALEEAVSKCEELADCEENTNEYRISAAWCAEIIRAMKETK